MFYILFSNLSLTFSVKSFDVYGFILLPVLYSDNFSKIFSFTSMIKHITSEIRDKAAVRYLWAAALPLSSPIVKTLSRLFIIFVAKFSSDLAESFAVFFMSWRNKLFSIVLLLTAFAISNYFPTKYFRLVSVISRHMPILLEYWRQPTQNELVSNFC